MNCHDMARLMDDGDPRSLAAAERAAVASHLSDCIECRTDWQVFERVLAKRIAPPSARFVERLWRELRAQESGAVEPGRAARMYLLGGLLLVGTAAAVIAWQSAREPIVAGGPASGLSPGTGPVAQTGSATGDAIAPSSAGPADSAAGDEVTALVASNRPRLLILPTIHSNPSPAAIEATDAIDAAVTRALRRMPYFEVVEIVEAQIEAADIIISPRAGPPGFVFPVTENDRDRGIARHFGGEFAVRVQSLRTNDGVPPDMWLVNVRSVDSTGGHAEIVQNDPPLFEFRETYEAAGERLARLVAAELLPDQEQAIWEGVIMDTRAADAVRLDALEMWNRPGTLLGSRRTLSGVAIDSAIELARDSTDPTIRSALWKGLGFTADPAVMLPLVDALRVDPDAGVRGAAADALDAFALNPTARAVLEGAVNNDDSVDVRLRARWTLTSFDERLNYVQASLRDSSLSVDSRVAPLILFRERYNAESDAGLLGEWDPQLLEFLGNQALDSANPAVRIAALRELGQSARPEFLSSLLDSARNDVDGDVRRRAISALRTYRQVATNPNVDEYVATLFDALDQDPDPRIRGYAAKTLGSEMSHPASGSDAIADRLRAIYETETDFRVRANIEAALNPPEWPTLREQLVPE